MANNGGPFGLRPYKILGSAYNSQGQETFEIASATAVMYQGMAVRASADGTIVPWGGAGGNVSNTIIGVFMGCNYVEKTFKKPVWSPYWPGASSLLTGTTATCTVVTNPEVLFLINCDGAIANDAIHSVRTIVSHASGDAITGQSRAQLDASENNVANAPLRIIGFADTPDNSDTSVAGRHAIVQINHHFYRQLLGI